MNVEQRQSLDKCVAELNKMKSGDDAEARHVEAEELICGLLAEIGFGEAAEAFVGANDKVGFWYA